MQDQQTITLCTNERVLLVEGRQLTSWVCFVAKSQLLILERKALWDRRSRGGPTLYEVHPGPQRLRSRASACRPMASPPSSVLRPSSNVIGPAIHEPISVALSCSTDDVSAQASRVTNESKSSRSASLASHSTASPDGRSGARSVSACPRPCGTGQYSKPPRVRPNMVQGKESTPKPRLHVAL